MSDLFAIRHRTEPLHSGVGAMRTFDDVIDVRNAVPVNYRSDLRQWRTGAFSIQTGSIGNDSSREGQMTACGFASHDNAVRIDVVCFCLIRDVPQSAHAVLDCSGRKRDASETIFDIDDIPAHFEP